ncbi:MAG TPA: group 1 truncated hemoglobin [Nitrospiria bacterium]|nr:group 1 truncated hemoglobin [Nitrospiria bacterium]
MNSFRIAAVVGLSVALAAVGCARHTTPEASLYDRLGGKPAITAVVGDFLQKVGSDGRIQHQPAPERVPMLTANLVDLVCQAAGGPCEYRGRPMKAAHAGMGITEGEFEAVVDDLVQTLDRYKVPEREKNELLAMLAPMRGDIVEAQ